MYFLYETHSDRRAKRQNIWAIGVYPEDRGLYEVYSGVRSFFFNPWRG